MFQYVMMAFKMMVDIVAVVNNQNMDPLQGSQGNFIVN